MKLLKSKKQTLLRRILTFMIALTAIQVGILLLSLQCSHVNTLLMKNTLANQRSAAELRKNSLEFQISHFWSNKKLYQPLIAVSQNAYKAYKNGTEPLAISTQIANQLIYLLRDSKATGAYIFFTETDRTNGIAPCLYIHDFDPDSNMDGNQDILAEAGSASICKQLKLTFNSNWKPYATSMSKYAFYRTALSYKEEASAHGSWTILTDFNDNTISALTYSLPVFAEDGHIFAVIGIDVTLDYLNTQIPFYDPDTSESCYLLGTLSEDAQTLTPHLTTGRYKAYIEQEHTLPLTVDKKYPATGTYLFETATGKSLLVSTTPLKLMQNPDSASKEQWVLGTVNDPQKLFHHIDTLYRYLLFAILLTLTTGILFSLFFSSYLGNKLKHLVNCLSDTDAATPVRLPKTNITEIDQLASAVETMSQEVIAVSSRVAEIIHASNLSLGIIEINATQDSVFCTRSVFDLLNIPTDYTTDVTISLEEYRNMVTAFEARNPIYQEETIFEENHATQIQIYECTKEPFLKQYIEFHIEMKTDRTFIVLTDVSHSIFEKQRIEYERDYDELTHLYNRVAFKKKVKEQLAQKKYTSGAMIMWDLDNLKFVNDRYGHEAGDNYIRAAADVFSVLARYDGIVARRSGDEFFAFLLNNNSKEETLGLITHTQEELKNTSILLPNGQEMRVRASCGIAWYPENGEDYDNLIQKADFAMYDIKRRQKGHVNEFNPATFEQDKILIYGKEELNKLLDTKALRMAFQPIINIQTGEIFAYEALLRPQLESLHSPYDVIRLARSQSRLTDLEWLTTSTAMDTFFHTLQPEKHIRLFVNSFPNIALPKAQEDFLATCYKKELNRLTIEIIECEDMDPTTLTAKRSFAALNHCNFALDDFGAGYSTESRLIDLNPDYIKIDARFVKNVHNNAYQQEMIHELVIRAKHHGMHIIVEGVECEEELHTLQQLGADYVQGFYLARPSFSLVSDADKELIKQKIKHAKKMLLHEL